MCSNVQKRVVTCSKIIERSVFAHKTNTEQKILSKTIQNQKVQLNSARKHYKTGTLRWTREICINYAKPIYTKVEENPKVYTNKVEKYRTRVDHL